MNPVIAATVAVKMEPPEQILLSHPRGTIEGRRQQAAERLCSTVLCKPFELERRKKEERRWKRNGERATDVRTSGREGEREEVTGIRTDAVRAEVRLCLYQHPANRFAFDVTLSNRVKLHPRASAPFRPGSGQWFSTSPDDG
jgi:hypothetical protein